MIRFDGYYKSPPAPYEDSIANYSEDGYFHNAYYLLRNGTYLKAVKKSKSTKSDFLESDFNPDFSNKYEVKSEKLEMFFETGTEWEFSEVFEIISPEELKGKERTLRFVPWTE